MTNKEKNSFHYYPLCKDQYSKFIFAYILDSKSDVNQALMLLIAEFEYASGKQIRCIASDNGSEFVKKANQVLSQKNVSFIRSQHPTPRHKTVK